MGHKNIQFWSGGVMACNGAKLYMRSLSGYFPVCPVHLGVDKKLAQSCKVNAQKNKN
jgi:hypothetical protein